jgi:hypothetical protein
VMTTLPVLNAKHVVQFHELSAPVAGCPDKFHVAVIAEYDLGWYLQLITRSFVRY